jgi:hypothetical protein
VLMELGLQYITGEILGQKVAENPIFVYTDNFENLPLPFMRSPDITRKASGA